MFVVVVVALLGVVVPALAGEEGFDYRRDSFGPGQWGCLSNNWTTCRAGSHQSPIHVKSQQTVDDCLLGKVELHFSNSSGALVSERYVYRIEFNSTANNFLTVDGMKFRLLQFHFHHPSEHFIDGKKFDLEMHMVFKATDNSSRLAVVTQMFKKGKPSSLLAQALAMKTAPMGSRFMFDLSKSKLGGEYFRYIGSLTTPPCTEDVIWTIFLKHKTASKEQIRAMRKYLKGNNARPLQKLNGREVYAYTYYQNLLR